MLKYDVYIALAMHGRLGSDVLAQGGTAIEICKKLRLTCYAPWADEAVEPRKIIDKKPNRKLMTSYVSKDFKHLDECRAIVVLTGDKSSSGTAWEMARMYFKHRRPIILVAPRMHDKMLVNFTTVLADKICATQLQAFKWLKRRLK